MLRKGIVLMSLLLLLAVVGTGCGLLQETAAPSAPIEAIPLAGVTTEAEAAAPTAETAAEPTAETAAEPTANVAQPPDGPATEAATEPAASGLRVFVIDQGASRVRFELDEDLRGQRTTVVGETDQVAGELALDPADLSQTQIGTLQINARTLLTDQNMRNRAIHNEILDTGGFEFISFVPTGIEGLPASAAVGDTVEFTINGDLTIRDITKPAAFTVTATLVSPDQITGTASTVVTRGDYELRIPNVPNVANVEEEVELYIDFTANAS